MTSTQRSGRRRTVLHAFEDENGAAQPSAKRPRLEKPVDGTSNKTKTSYDEVDDGFQFSRSRAKKPQNKVPAPELTQSEPIVEETRATTPPKRKRKKYSFSDSGDRGRDAAPMIRRSKRLSGEKANDATSGPAPHAARVPDVSGKHDHDDQLYKTKDTAIVDSQPAVLQVPPQPAVARSPKKIALPFADTPVIRRNKEMRRKAGDVQSHRRSSTGMRGRRASSLIESGHSNAVPHADVEVRDFYKHIEQSLPEPRRMQQLLTWCGTRALPEKQTGNAADGGAGLAARHIEEEILKAFSNKPEISDWFSREENEPAEAVKKPNPRNVQMAARLELLEAEIARLQAERDTWTTILGTSKTSSIPRPPEPATQPPAPVPSDGERRPKLRPPPVEDPEVPPSADDQIDVSLLDPAQAAIYSALSSGPSATFATGAATTEAGLDPVSLSGRLTELAARLEPSIDLLADGVHKLVRYRAAAEGVADRVLADAARGLERRARDVRSRVVAERRAEGRSIGGGGGAGSAGAGRDVKGVLEALAGVLNGE